MSAKKEKTRKVRVLLDADVVNMLILRKSVGKTYSEVIREMLTEKK